MTPERLKKYRETAFQRFDAEKKILDQRFSHAWKTARSAAALLKKRGTVKKVAVFGSLLDKSAFHQRSDIDLAVWGLDEKLYFRAVAWLMMDMDTDIDINIVRIEDAKESLRQTIESEGVVI